MKLIISILFSALVFLAGTKNLLFIVDYHVNIEYYESVCENQNRPEMNCHGKCQATKDADQTANSISFKHFSFDFYPTIQTTFSVPQTDVASDALGISPHGLSYWTPVSLGVPNPPPNS